MYDIFFLGKNVELWESLKRRYPNAQRLDENLNFIELSKKSFTKMFWVIWDDIILSDKFDLNSYRATQWDNQYVHVFKNGNYFDGICLFPKSTNISNREFENRFFSNKKEIDIEASNPIVDVYDIIFISYFEPNADENFKNLKARFPRAKRVDKVKGIHQAHIEAAKLSETEMFYVVDGDAIIVEDFNFDHIVARYERNHVHVWRSQNPINGLIYGYGGIKLLPKKLTLEMDVTKPDMTTSISKNFKEMPFVSNITSFNTDPFNTWKSAFRECVKLSSKIIDRQVVNDTEERLKIWCTVGSDKPFGKYSILGAQQGKEFGFKHRTDPTSLFKINDFVWLREKFNEIQ